MLDAEGTANLLESMATTSLNRLSCHVVQHRKGYAEISIGGESLQNFEANHVKSFCPLLSNEFLEWNLRQCLITQARESILMFVLFSELPHF